MLALGLPIAAVPRPLAGTETPAGGRDSGAISARL